jgi:hypothetical protein
MLAFWHWLVFWAGCSAGAAYGHFVPNDFWAGIGSDIGEYSVAAAILGGSAGYYRKHRCHALTRRGRKCRWIGRHVVDGTPWCDRHHEKARSAARAAGQDPKGA